METPARWRELFQEGRGRLTAGVLLIEFLVAVEALVVVAIMPAVKRDLGGLQYYGLVFTGYSLAALVASPFAGRQADRRGPARPFLIFAVIFIIGTLLSGLASSMLWLVAARLIQGFGAGGAYTVELAAVTRIYPESGRARILALLAGAWFVPGLLGPSFGALLASTVGWRWAFFSIIPLTILALGLGLPALRTLAPSPSTGARSAIWRRLGLAIVRAQPGMPAAVLMIFLLIFAFVETEYFLPLILTSVRGRSLAEVGLLITCGTISWSLGSWWQSRAIARLPVVTLMRIGAAIYVLAIAGTTLLLTGLPIPISYVSWFAAGVGIGIAYPTVYLVIMRGATRGGEGLAVSSEQVAERLALALGGAAGGTCVALALSLHAPLSTGLGGALGLALIGALAALLLAPRLVPMDY